MAAVFSMGSSTEVVSWEVLCPLLSQHKLRIAVPWLLLLDAPLVPSPCTYFLVIFFDILIGRGTGPLWTLLSKIAVLYILEPIFTVIYVINMTTIWEKVMASLRGQIVRRMLIQKVEFFNTFKVGELTGLLTLDLGSLKDAVSKNISRDRGLRALSEASYFTFLTMSA